MILAGRAVELTATEFDLLAELAAHAGRVLKHEDLLRRVWRSRNKGDARVVHTFVRRLRRKLGDDASDPAYILTEPRVGYRMPGPRRRLRALPSAAAEPTWRSAPSGVGRARRAPSGDRGRIRLVRGPECQEFLIVGLSSEKQHKLTQTFRYISDQFC